MRAQFKKYGGRLGIGLLIYLFFKVTHAESTEELTTWDLKTKILLTLTIFVVVIVWEACDHITSYFVRKYPLDVGTNKRLMHLFFTVTLYTFPLVIAYIYFENYYIKVWLQCIEEEEMISEFWSETMNAFVITWLIIGFKMFHVQINHTAKIERAKDSMQKELLRSKYESLKSQINPHFLFNSYSVLTTLIHTNPDQAVDFLNQLSKMYRYILDNKENEMVSLEKEFKFLESYLFLLKTRHEDGILVDIEVSLDRKNFFVPTLALQMLIENAVKHNAFSQEQPLMIRIFNEKDDYLVVSNEIRRKGEVVNSTKVGLENICKRYNIQSEKQVVVNQTGSDFIVKLPILPSLNMI